MASDGQSQLLQTALRVIEGYNKWDIDAILAPRAENCTQQVLPYRLGRPVLNNTEYREYFSSIMPSFHNFHLEILDIVEDEKNAKVAINAVSTAETALGSYGNEYVVILHMTPDHKQVEIVKEFVDSGFSDEFFKRLREHNSRQEA